MIANYLDEFEKHPIEIFGYGSGGASHIESWLSLATDLGIKAAGLFDGDPAGRIAYGGAEKRFKNNPNIRLELLPTDDIRDKPEQGTSGIFDENWKIKAEYIGAWEKIIARIADFLGGKP